MVRFLAAMYAANQYLNMPAKKNCSVTAIARQLNVSTSTAELEYTSATQSDTGEVSPGGNFTVNQQGLINIINVRQEFGGFASLPPGFDFSSAITPGPGKLIDYCLRNRAVELFKRSLLSTSC